MRLSMFVSATAMMVAAGPVLAGGFVAPEVQIDPITIAPAPVAGTWAGAYGGGSLGYIMGTDDQLGLATIRNGEQVSRANNLGDLGISGPSFGLHGGYRWQRDNWVFGPELGFEIGSVDEEVTFAYGADTASSKSELNHIITLVMKTGYTVDPQTLVYGTFGLARGDFDYTLALNGRSETKGFTATGIAAGLGVERMINDTTSVFAEYQYRDFGNETVNFTDGADTLSTRASMSMSSIKVGANFRF